MATPFDAEGALDLDGAAVLARHLVAHGSEGLVVSGTTGESAVLTDEERLSLIAAVAEAVRVPVLAGTTTNDTQHSVLLTSQAAALGAAGILAVTPYYNRPPQAGIAAHFSAVARSTSLPVILYDIPARTGRKIQTATTLSLAREQANIVAVKDASGDLKAAAELIAQAPEGFELYSGDDVLTLSFMALGAVGVISVAAHWMGSQMKECLEAFVAGDVDRAAALEAALLVSYDFESSERWPNPLPTKAMLRALGLPSGQCRLPMGPSDPELDVAAVALVEQLGLNDG
jgi:4-hydroxy-tetrahydrodipicolinate synthase